MTQLLLPLARSGAVASRSKDCGSGSSVGPEKRMSAVMAVCGVLAGALILRAGWLQIGPNERLEKLSRRQFSSRFLIKPPRGAILDRNGEPLAINTETRSLAMNPSKIPHARMVARLLAKALDLPYARVLQKISDQKKEFSWIKRHISDTEFDRLKTFGIMGRDGDLISGIWVVNESERAYPHNELASHVIGGVNLDTEGTEGVELWKDQTLSGKVFSISAVKDALGRPAFIDASAAKSSEEGKDGEPITLTLDASLQFEVEKDLHESVARSGSKSGTVIVMNAMTGEILAMANEPSYNLNLHDIAADRKRNRALTDGYEPGSTMKPILLSAALQSGMKLTDTVWGERGHFKLQGHLISESEARERFEWISLKKVIQVSSNIGAAKIALKIGPDKYISALKQFGFSEKTGTGFPGEISGRIPPRKSWQPITLANIGFGQGVLVTPMQMTRAYAAFLNGGWLVEPSLLLVKDAKQTLPPKRILSEKVTSQVLEALEAVTVTKDGGTGGQAVLEGYRVAGKTGTAQKVDPRSHKYSRFKHVASFIGFPLGVDQKIVIFTSLDEPKGVYYGGAVAAPLFREVLGAVASRFSLPTPMQNRTLASVEAPRSSPPVKAVAQPQADVIQTAQAAPSLSLPEPLDPQAAWKMPPLKGLTPREAIEALEGHDLKLEIKGEGLIRGQIPEEGRTIHGGEVVHLELGSDNSEL